MYAHLTKTPTRESELVAGLLVITPAEASGHILCYLDVGANVFASHCLYIMCDHIHDTQDDGMPL